MSRATDEAPFSETRRQIVHMAMGGFALLLRYLTWWQAAILAAAAFGFNLLVLPHFGGRTLFRPHDRVRGHPTGILLYPISVLLLILLFPGRPDIAAAAWGILAIGDGSATLIGRAVRGPRLPWNPDKSVAGSLAFVTLGWLTAALLAMWTAPAVHAPPSFAYIWIATFVASLAAALVESLALRLDDNLAVPLLAGAVLWAQTFVHAEVVSVAWPDLRARLPGAVLVNGLSAAAAYAARTVSPSGVIVGLLLGITIYTFGGGAAFVVLLLAFALASGATRIGLKRKTVLGIAEDRGGARGAGNALANTVVAAFTAVLSVFSHHPDAFRLALVAALATGAGDTVASEIGKAWGRRTVLITGFRSVRPGTSGAVSLEGTAAGLAASLVLAWLGAVGHLIAPRQVLAVGVAALIGSAAESVLGATAEPRGWVSNDLLNFINTLVGSAAAVLLVSLARWL